MDIKVIESRPASTFVLFIGTNSYTLTYLELEKLWEQVDVAMQSYTGPLE